MTGLNPALVAAAAAATGTVAGAANRPSELLMARKRIQGLIRATLTVHYRGPEAAAAAAAAAAAGTGEAGSGDPVAAGEALRLGMVR